MLKVLEYFTDNQDNSFAYNVGDTYPRKGYTPSPERVEELSSDKNLRKRPVIAEETAEAVAEVAAEETAEEDPVDVPDTNVGDIENDSEAENAEEKPKKRKKREE